MQWKMIFVFSYAVAAQTERVIVYKPNSTIVDSEIELSIYDRVVRIANVPTVRLPLFISIIHVSFKLFSLSVYLFSAFYKY